MGLLVWRAVIACLIRPYSSLRRGNSFVSMVLQGSLALLVGRSAIFLFEGTHSNHAVKFNWFKRYQARWVTAVIISGLSLFLIRAFAAFSLSR